MTRVLTQIGLACLLAGTLGAAPGQKTSDSRAKETPHSPTVKTVAVSSDKSAPKVVKTAKGTMVPKKSEAKPYQVGNASWYGELFQGKETASGETYDMYRYTAAHMQLPLGTWVKVTNLKNNKFVVVRVNDRGPVTPGRTIDLSYSAAKQLKMAGRGVAKVRVDVLPVPANAPAGNKPTVLEAGLR